MWMFLHILEHVLVSVCDDKSVAEDLHDGSDVHVIGSIEHRLVWR
mgnify:CR=1 FL=1